MHEDLYAHVSPSEDEEEGGGPYGPSGTEPEDPEGDHNRDGRSD